MRKKDKRVTYKHLKIGQEVHGWQHEDRRVSTTAYVKEVNSAYVTVSMYRPESDEIRKIDSICMFDVEMTDDEYKQKWHKSAKEIYAAFQNHLHQDEIGHHDSDNHWLNTDIYEMADDVSRMHAKIIGICTDIIPRTSWISNTELDVGICVEYDDGERMWCHWMSEWIEYILEEYAQELGPVPVL